MSDWSEALTVTIVNLPPEAPSINGPRIGKVGEYSSNKFTFSSTDPDGSNISYYIKWGDGTITEWTNFKSSDTPHTENHAWDSKGKYTIQAKVKDAHGVESDWSTFEISIPYNRITNYNPIMNFIKLFMQNIFNRIIMVYG
jgi:hypothetical protein